MISLWKGKIPIYFGVIMSKVNVTVTINIIFDNRIVLYRRAYFVMHTFLVVIDLDLVSSTRLKSSKELMFFVVFVYICFRL